MYTVLDAERYNILPQSKVKALHQTARHRGILALLLAARELQPKATLLESSDYRETEPAKPNISRVHSKKLKSERHASPNVEHGTGLAGGGIKLLRQPKIAENALARTLAATPKSHGVQLKQGRHATGRH
jgi:hypothetical protein